MMLVGEAAGWMGARVLRDGKDVRITGVSTDSRHVAPGELFFALQGERFDGHEFVAAALARGAAGAVVARLVEPPGEQTAGGALLLVPDTLRALQQLAQNWRRRFVLPVVGVTGSNGKTTTKDITAAVLGSRWSTLKSIGNQNNEIGLPLTLLKLTAAHQAAVVEMGMRGRGQISDLCRIARPTIGIITNIGLTHLELLGSPANIASAKAELLEHIPPDGLAMLNRDDPRSREVSARCPGRVRFFGLDMMADVRAVDINPRGFAGTEFTVLVDGHRARVLVPAPGVHNVYNALAAIGAGYYLGLNLDEITAGLARTVSSGMRQEVRRSVGGFTVINDAYNANPVSMQAALRVLKELSAQRSVAVLGDMYELGPAETEGHREVGRAAAALNIDLLVAVGPLSRTIADAAVAAGMPAERVNHFALRDAAAVFLRGVLRETDTVLVKASRGMKMEAVVEQIME